MQSRTVSAASSLMPAELESLANAIKALGADPAERDRIDEAARRASEVFSWDTFTLVLEDAWMRGQHREG